jgi:LysM repeat protein
MGENDLLQIGQVIRLPMPNGVGGPVAAVTSGVLAGKQVHVVRTGETLWTIAARYQIAWEDVAVVNELGEYDLLQIGQELKLPASLDEPAEEEAVATGDESSATSSEESAGEAGGGFAADSASGGAAAQGSGEDENATTDAADEGARFSHKSSTSTSSTGGSTYTVKSGDTLLGIALTLDMTWEELAAANDLTEDTFLQIGQKLDVPGAEIALMSAKTNGAPPAEEAETSAEGTPGRIHRVAAGDTIYGIALEYGVDMQELLRLNDLDEDSLLQLDQEIVLP